MKIRQRTKFFLTLFLLLPLLGAAQEVGISTLKINSGHYELESPRGIGLAAAYPLNKKMRLAVEYSYFKNERVYFGFLSAGFFIAAPPTPQSVESNTTLHVVEIGVMVDLFRIYNFQISANPSLGWSILDANRYGRSSGETADLYGTTKPGLGFALRLETPDVRSLPFIFFLSAKAKVLLSSNILITDVEVPFHEEIGLTQLQAGVSFRFK